MPLPARWYHDPAHYALERERVLANAWSCVGPAHAVKQGGGWLCEAHAVAGRPLLLVRDREGVLRAFVNACRHRGAPLREPGTGTDGELRCPYHGWVYGLDGGLRAARDFGADADVTRGLRLQQMAVDTWRGLVFVRAGSGGAGLDASLGALPSLAEGFDLDALRRHTRRTLDIACNWKVYVENYNEGYHVPLLHPSLARNLDMRAYTVEVLDDLCVHRAPARGGEYGGLFAWRFPDLTLGVYGHGMNVTRVVPLGPTRTRLVIDFYFAEGVDGEQQVAETCALLDEDAPICEAVQANLETGVVEPGPLSPRHENGLAAFHALLRAALGNVA